MVEDAAEIRCRRCIRVKQGECDDWRLNDDWTWTCPHCLTSLDRGTIADRLRHSAARVRAVGRVQYREAMSQATRLEAMADDVERGLS